MELIKNVQTILRILFEHKDLILSLIVISGAMSVVIECSIEIVKNTKCNNEKKDNWKED